MPARSPSELRVTSTCLAPAWLGVRVRVRVRVRVGMKVRVSVRVEV